MANKARRSKKKTTTKWSRANIMNLIAGGIVAFSMVLGSVFVFGGAAPTASSPTVTPVPTVISTPASIQAGPTPTIVVTPAATP